MIETLNKFDGKKLSNFPEIKYSNLYKKVSNNFYFEFIVNNDKYLFSPYYSLLRGAKLQELIDLVSRNEIFLDSLKKYITNSLFAYSAIIEENSYYLMKPQSIIISRMISKDTFNYEIKFYTHYDDELLNTYSDKIYIGRNFINLEEFEQKSLGLEDNFLSLIEQNIKIQERAKQKLKDFNAYKKPYLNEIEYMINETATDALNRIKYFPEKKLSEISKIKINEILDSILYIHNLMIELKDFTQEFENKLRLKEENNFVKYLTKFSKDLITDIRYLRKLSSQIHLKISNFSIF